MIYLDNAATTYPKPEAVYQSVDNAFRHLGSAGRGAHQLALQAARAVFAARSQAAEFLGIASERLIFTPGCTYSINFVLKGLPLKLGDTVVVSALEHNAVMRPLQQLEREKGIRVVVLPYTPGAIVSRADLLAGLEDAKPRLCVLCEGSNVTGEVLDLEMAARECRRVGVPLLVDAAQTAGRRRLACISDGVTFWAASAHKGLFGPPGLGLLYVHAGYDVEPIISGGTGSASESFDVPVHYPDHLEVGTAPVPAIAGLAAGIEFLNQNSVESIQAHELSLTDEFLAWCRAQPFIAVSGSPSGAYRLPTVSFELKGLGSDRVADELDTKYGIAVRTGLHCAAQAHSTLGTIKRGLIRASFGFFNSASDVRVLCQALTAIASRSRS